VVDGTTALYTSNSTGTQFASLPGKALDRIECWLTPQSAFAALPGACTRQGLVFAGETFVMGVGTVGLFPAIEIIGPWAIHGYFVGWGLWTSSMYDLLHCLTYQRPKPKRPAVPENTVEFGF